MGITRRLEFLEDVFKTELAEIKARRAAVRGRITRTWDDRAAEHPRDIDLDAEPARPSVDRELVGLALSGGGIRSAAFSLGVLQALNGVGIFSYVDYLSTVSGGGWIGSCLSALMRDPAATFPFVPRYDPGVIGARDAHDVGPPNLVLEHLRDRTSALVPAGFAGGSGMLARVVRGSLITIAMLTATLVAPAMLLAALVRRYLQAFPPSLLASPRWSSFMVATPRVVVATLLLLLLMPVLRTVFPGRRRLSQLDPLFVGCAALCLAVLAFETHVFVTYRATPPRDVAPLTVGTFFLHLFQLIRPMLTPSPTTWLLLGACAVGLIAFRAALARAVPLLRVAALALVAIGSLAPLYLFVLYVSIVGSGPDHAALTDLVFGWRSGVLPVSLLGVSLMVLMDTNEASLHSVFRRQIAKLFIVRKTTAGTDEADEEIAPDEDVLLTGLAQPGSVAPYHLLNAALNLQGDNDPSLRGRRGDFFVFSKRFVGGPRTGYCRTEDLQRVTPDLDLAMAMTTSAAAAAPNMGTYTMRPLVLLLAFLNLRLGYWLLNPARVAPFAEQPVGLWERLRSFPAGWCYFRELASALHAQGQHVYLSDGGHLENTGAYELLRRRCKYVIVCDAEEDPAMRFGGMAALLRFARLDLGVEIDLSLDDLAPDERGVTRRHSALARIHYSARDGMQKETGWLLYLKSSLTGDEHPVIGQYRAESPSFPHESTANQAFGEAQFEAYRALGEHVTRGLAGKVNLDKKIFWGEDPVAAWFHAIEARVTSSPRYDKLYPGLRDELEEVEALLRAPEAAGYFAELYPELVPRQTWPEVAPAVLHEIAMRQIHLMASVYTQLQLDDERALEHPWHRGWLQTFRRWMASPSFRRVWIVGAQSYGPWFRKFCQENLDCLLLFQWQPCSSAELAQNDLALAPPEVSEPYVGALHFRADVSVFIKSAAAVEVEYVAALRILLSRTGDSAELWPSGSRARPGFEDLARSPEADAGLDELLHGVGLPRLRVSFGYPLREDLQSLLDGLLERPVDAAVAASPATPAVGSPSPGPAVGTSSPAPV